MKVVFFIFARNKVKDIERSMKSALTQTYSPLTVVVSDQGSEDGTRELIQEIGKSYSGPHDLLLLDCPKTDVKGMAGLNTHINWIDETVKGDVFIASSADDFAEPERTEKTVEVFQESNADVVMTRHRVIREDGTLKGYTAFPEKSGWVNLKDCVDNGVGGSGSIAWRQSFYKLISPLPNLICNDLYIPILATVKNGLYFIEETLHNYVEHPDPKNTGLEGRISGTTDQSERLKLGELALYQISSSYLEIMKRMIKWGVNEGAMVPILDKMISLNVEWINQRNIMESLKVQPMNFS